MKIMYAQVVGLAMGKGQFFSSSALQMPTSFVSHKFADIFRCMGWCIAVAVTTIFFQGVGKAQTVIHPTKENIPVSSDPRFELRHEVDGVDFWHWNSSSISEIGMNEGDNSQMLGVVFDLETDQEGTVYYLDLILEEVRAYDYEGNWIGNVANPGIGPGELESPLGLLVIPDSNQIIVADQLTNHVFERNEVTFELVSTQRPKYPSSNGQLCVMNGHYYLAFYDMSIPASEQKIIHKYTLDGEWVTSFREPYAYDNPLFVSKFASETFIACNPEHNTIAVLTNHIPAMTGYSDQGEQLWQVTFPDYRPDVVEERVFDGRVHSTLMFEAGTSVFRSLFSNGEYFYVTYVFRKKASGPFHRVRFSESHAFRVNAHSGLGVYLGAAGPEIGELLVAMDEEYRFTVTKIRDSHRFGYTVFDKIRKCHQFTKGWALEVSFALS